MIHLKSRYRDKDANGISKCIILFLPFLPSNFSYAAIQRRWIIKWNKSKRGDKGALIKQGEKYDLSGAITAGSPAERGGNIGRKTRKQEGKYIKLIAVQKKNFVIFFFCCVIPSTRRLWKQLWISRWGIDHGSFAFNRLERKFLENSRPKLLTFSKLIPPISTCSPKGKKVFQLLFPPSSLLFLAEYFNKTLRGLMGMKKVSFTRFVYKIQKEETGVEVKFSIDRENSNNYFSIRKRLFYFKKLRWERYKSCITSTSIFRLKKKKKRKSIFDFARFNNSGRIMNGRIL